MNEYVAAASWGVFAYLLSWLYMPIFFLLIDLAHPVPLINAV